MFIETIKRPELIFGLLVATCRGSGNAVDPESAALLPVASHIRTTRQGVTEYVIETPHERSPGEPWQKHCGGGRVLGTRLPVQQSRWRAGRGAYLGRRGAQGLWPSRAARLVF